MTFVCFTFFIGWPPAPANDCAEASIILELRGHGASVAPHLEPRTAIAAMADLKARIATESRRTAQTNALQ